MPPRLARAASISLLLLDGSGAPSPLPEETGRSFPLELEEASEGDASDAAGPSGAV